MTKSNRDGEGGKRLANEMLGHRLCTGLGISVPQFQVIQVKQTGLAMQSKDAKAPLVSANNYLGPGEYFASRYLPQLFSATMLEITPQWFYPQIINVDECLGVFVFDVWAMHADRRQALFKIGPWGLRAIFIDHGDLFGGPNWSQEQQRVDIGCIGRAVLNHPNLLFSLENWIVRLQTVIPDILSAAITEVPNSWCDHRSKTLLEHFLMERLSKLRYHVAEAVMSLCAKEERFTSIEGDETKASHVLLLAPNGFSTWERV